jgi:hypothetical protein
MRLLRTTCCVFSLLFTVHLACGKAPLAVGGKDGGSDAAGDVQAPRDAADDGSNFVPVSPDCPGCTFPPPTASSCAASAPPISLVYPPDGALVPPNMGVISVQWTPYGSSFVRFEVHFHSANSDWGIVTKCAMQTIDAQSGAPSGGCELIVDPLSWSTLVSENRGGDSVTITVRGTTNGDCVTSSNSVRLSFAEQDLIGTYSYWKSNIQVVDITGQVWGKTFGQVETPERQVASALSATCTGCHVPSRDGSRMVVYQNPLDSDTVDTDVFGVLLDMTMSPDAKPIGPGADPSAGVPAGFSAISPTAGIYVTSNGLPQTTDPFAAPANGFTVWDAQTGAFIGPATIGAVGIRPTMPAWSADGTSLVYVQPTAVASWRQGQLNDDNHIFGGSLFTVPYASGTGFGAPSLLLQSGGENNYYPSYSPDAPSSLVLFDRAPLDTRVGMLTGCTGTFPKIVCPNDSYYNPAARLMVMPATGGSGPLDLELANGSPASSPDPLSNSFPRWVPVAQTYKGQPLMWVVFSSTRDYGLRVLNHKATGMYPCYPADSYQGGGRGVHTYTFSSQCQEPQLWLAPLFPSEVRAGNDPSGVAIWLPYQDPSKHNHMPEWSMRE